MSLKALAKQVLERNASRNTSCNSPENRPTPTTTPPAPVVVVAAFEERAAIVEEGAHVPREWAEGFARLEIAPCPPGVTVAVWRAMINGAGRFLDQWGSHAAALGWTAGELFGLDADAPLNRRDRRGAAFFLTRATVVAITANAITLKIDGTVQHIRRRDGFTIPAWENFE